MFKKGVLFLLFYIEFRGGVSGCILIYIIRKWESRFLIVDFFIFVFNVVI